MENISRGHLEYRNGIGPNNRFSGTPFRKVASIPGQVQLIKPKIGDIVKVIAFKVIGESRRNPDGFKARIMDAVPDQCQAFLPHSAVRETRFKEIAAIIHEKGYAIFFAKIVSHSMKEGNFLLSLQKVYLGSDNGTDQKPQSPAEPESISPAQMELAHKDLTEGKFVKVKLIDVYFEQLKKDTPNVRATFTCEFCAEKVSASIKFNPHLIKQRGLKLLARYQETVMVRRQPPTEKKLSPASDQQIPLKFDEEDLLLKAKTLFDKEQALKNSQRNQSV